MGNLPTLKVLLDDGSGTFPYNITAYVLATDGYSVTRGRDDWQAAVTAGSLDLTLNNSDGRFTPGSTLIASPTPIVVDQRIRLQETVNGVTYTRFTGYVKSWPVEWPATVPTFAEVKLTATDAQARAERRPLRTSLAEEIVHDGASAYYSMAEELGATTAGDTSGNQMPALTPTGTGAPVVFGNAAGPGPDGVSAATMTGGQCLTATATSNFTSASGWAIECWVNIASPPVGLPVLAWTAQQQDGTFAASLQITTGGQADTAGPGAAGPNICDGLPHQVVVENTGGTQFLYVDGVSVGSGAHPTTAANTLTVGGPPLTGLFNVITGTVSNVATWTTPALGGAGAFRHYQAGSTGFAGESSASRVARIMGYIPIVAGGGSDLALTTLSGRASLDSTAWAEIQTATDAEMGVTFIDGNGQYVFHNRNRVVSKTTPDLTLSSQWITPDVAPVNDDQQLTNYMEVTAEGTGVTSLARNAASDTSHGRYPGSRSYSVLTDAAALDRANWLVNNLAEPVTRYGTLTINLYGMTPAQQSTVLAALEIDCWLRVTSMAAQNPGGTTADVIVQGWQETTSASTWTITCNVVAQSLFAPVWIFDVSKFDTTTRFYV